MDADGMNPVEQGAPGPVADASAASADVAPDAADASDPSPQMFEPPAAASAATAAAFVPPDLPGGNGNGNGSAGESAIELLNDVALDVKVELGRTHMLVEDVLKLASGSVVELDKLAGDPVDIYVNERLVARGEVLVLNDDFCVRISEVVTPPEEAHA